tara:strand:- start:3575 stop:3679 length:105 start_codon:yes stop_codon:yes gene_type:complete
MFGLMTAVSAVMKQKIVQSKTVRKLNGNPQSIEL